MFYNGIVLPNRWGDNSEELDRYLEALDSADMITISSQRSIWSICRLPKMYPLTLSYYRALFDGSLGFDLALHEQRPFAFGPLQVSDLDGSISWKSQPELPLFNFAPLAAEEAFSVYDHAPVWVFVKSPRYSSAIASELLGKVDLSKIENQIPSETRVKPFK